MLCLLLALLAASAVYGQDRVSIASEPRVALVIGNSTYKVGPLKNPSNDAEDIASALRALGFRVTLRKDATQQQMVDAIAAFGKELRKGGVGLFYFAGHGVQSRGNNFLIPVNANVGSEAQLEFDTVNAARVLSEMDSAGNRVNIMILDACRDNPFARSFRTTSGGLVAMEAAKGTYISFATGPGSVAADGIGRNGVYTEQLLKSLRQPESEVDRVFRRVAADVSRATGGKQSPWGSHNLTGDFYFRLDSGANVALTTPTAPAAPQGDPRAIDRALWESVKDSNSAGELQAYLDQFPNGIFAGVARARLKTLATVRSPGQVATARPTAAPPVTSPAAVLAGSLQDFAAGTAFRDCDECPEMVVVPPGHFTMGANEITGGAKPPHSVNIPRQFAAGKFEVTFDEWDACVRERGCAHNPSDQGWGRGRRPAINVSWNDAKEYTQWLSTKTGKSYRLLTDAEWEYVARAGTTATFNTGANIEPAQANYSNYSVTLSFAGSATGTPQRQTVPVGSYQPNAFGLFDVHGNVWEWTEDCWNANHNGAPGDGSARTSGDCGQRVLRGGSWNTNAVLLRSAYRGSGSVSGRDNRNGFRLARTE
jgi:formylglycine-generating enzyme required for sulfatase activity/uncharacterized caspase-like protein